MQHLNSVSICGNLTRDPEYRAFPKGGGVTKLRLASSGFRDDATCFIDAEIIEREGSTRAQKAAELLKKGTAVGIVGRLEYNEFTNKEGVRISKHLIHVKDWNFNAPKSAGDGNAAPAKQEDPFA